MSPTLIADRSDRLRMSLSGEKAKEALGGLVTSDVLGLAKGEGQRGAALTAKGKVIAILRILDRGDDLLVDCDAAAAEGFTTMIRKFVNPRLAKYSWLTGTTGCIGVLGDEAAVRLAAGIVASGSPGVATTVDPDALAALRPLSGIWLGEGEEVLYVVRSTDFSAPGFDVIGTRSRVDALAVALRRAGATDATREELVTMRVEAGLPEWGQELDAETMPQEAGLDDLGAISFSKGCYTGQEVVARIHFRGRVNRHLRWLTAAMPIPVGGRVLDRDGNEVGEVRTSVRSPSRGPLAIAMVRREVEPGTVVRVASDGEEIDARVERIGGNG